MQNIKKHWNQQEEDFVRDNYLKMSIINIKKILNRSEQSILHKAHRLNLIKKPINNWRLAEIEFLSNNYLNMNNIGLSNRLNRKYGSIHNKIIQLGLKRPKELIQKMQNNEEHNQKLSETLKRLYKEGKFKSWNKNLTKETDERLIKIGQNISNTKKQMYEEGKLGKHIGGKGKDNPMYGRKAELSPNWQGGKSFEPYGVEFNKELKELIRKRDNYRCQECFRHQDELFKNTKAGIRKYKLHAHHIDFNKQNNNPNNLISLCNDCHMQTNYGRDNWINYFQEKINGVK